MSLLSHIDTRDLLALHDDLMLDKFCNVEWQKGEDGVITGTSLPCTFSSDNLNLFHYISDDDADYLSQEEQRVKLLTDDFEKPLPVLNIHGKGFFRIKSITNNLTCEIDFVRPSIQRIINRALNLDLDDTTVTEGTGLTWSLGAYEEKIAVAYCDLVTELVKRDAITADYLDSDDPTYINALKYRALQLIYTSLMTSPDDTASVLSARYYRLYQDELTNARPYGYTKRATRRLLRC